VSVPEERHLGQPFDGVKQVMNLENSCRTRGILNSSVIKGVDHWLVLAIPE
jgi:hypothetical protein